MALQTRRDKGMRFASTDSDCWGGQGPPRAAQPMMMMMMMMAVTDEYVVRNSKRGYFFRKCRPWWSLLFSCTMFIWLQDIRCNTVTNNSSKVKLLELIWHFTSTVIFRHKNDGPTSNLRRITMLSTLVITAVIARLLPNSCVIHISGDTTQLQLSETVLCCQPLKYVTYLIRY